jgi:glycerophosphoryl diester phosphodiesterase
VTLLDCLEQLVNKFVACLPRSKPDPQQMSHCKIIAHRGAHNKKLHCLENTVAAFERAQKLGCWGIELDVQTTADQIFVVNHDPTLNRLWGINRSIQDMTFQELRSLVPDIPSLEEIVEKYGQKSHLFIELKAPFYAEGSLVKALHSLIPCVDYHLISIDEPTLSSLTAFPRPCLLLVAGFNNTGKLCKLSLEKNYGGVLGHYLLLTNRRVQSLKQAGQCTGVGQINSKYSLYRELNRGISWIFSDNVTEDLIDP